MVSTKVIVSALALMGFALGASAHEGPIPANGTHGVYKCTATVSGSYLFEANTAHGKATELGKISAQGRFIWGPFDGAACGGGGGLTLLEGWSVTRAANGDLVFVDYTPDNGSFGGSNCFGVGPGAATVDVRGEVTGGTGRFADAVGQGVHTISYIYPSSNGNFGGTTTVSENVCLKD